MVGALGSSLMTMTRQFLVRKGFSALHHGRRFCIGRDPEVAVRHKPICSSRTELIIPGNMVQVKAHWSCTSMHGKSSSGEGSAHFPSFFSLAAARSSLSFRKSVTTARMDSRTAAANAASAKNSRGVGGFCYVTKRCLALTLHTSSYSWFT